MRFHLICELEDPYDDGADCLAPYIARVRERGIESRGATPEQAIGNVKGIILHWVGDMPSPPDEVIFKVVRLDLKS